jgi:GDP-L-fucose synthase
MAAACFHVMQNWSLSPDAPSFLNVGTGTDITIGEVAERICGIVGFAGETVYDESKPDGTPKKLLDTRRINEQGWSPRFNLDDGLRNAYEWYLRH